MRPTVLLDKADELLARGIFLGGVSRDTFVTTGRGQLEILLSRGLLPHHRVLDVGCGALRGGWWLINFLRPGRYHGIEPNTTMLDGGKEVMLGPDLIEEKRPSFSTNAEFDFSVFDERFDFVIARSIWTHASLEQIKTMLRGFLNHSTPEAEFVASICPPLLWGSEYQSTTWLGRSHESTKGGIANYRVGTIKRLCADMGPAARKLGVQDGQTWMMATREG
jgi:hypothetical protein